LKLVIISDTHFGDPDCTLFVRGRNNKPVPGVKYQQFLKKAGKKNDYLVLVGDIMDFAISSYEKAYDIARAFFIQIQKDNIADQIIYIPGNHDEDIWHTVEQEVNIIDRIKEGKFPRKFKMSLPGILDDRVSSKKKQFMLPGIEKRRIKGKIGYGGLFLDTITGKGAKTTRFNFVYPNMYIATDSDSVLITHGHYFETYWSLLSEWAPDIFGKDLPISMPMPLREMISINFPTNQLSCSGIGQAGTLTDAIRNTDIDIRHHRLKPLDRYLKNLAAKLAGGRNYSWYDPRRFIWVGVGWWVKKQILRSVRTIDEVRYNREFMQKPEVQDRFKRYYQRSCEEIESLNKKYGYDLPLPSVVLFGHTHQPSAWNSGDMHIEVEEGKTIRLCNTGGWLAKTRVTGEKEFYGAEVFKYQTEVGFSSETVS
jgi:UDP-2,3-diacylglucosamine pyrophosphatase LpxH